MTQKKTAKRTKKRATANVRKIRLKADDEAIGSYRGYRIMVANDCLLFSLEELEKSIRVLRTRITANPTGIHVATNFENRCQEALFYVHVSDSLLLEPDLNTHEFNFRVSHTRNVADKLFDIG